MDPESDDIKSHRALTKYKNDLNTWKVLPSRHCITTKIVYPTHVILKDQYGDRVDDDPLTWTYGHPGYKCNGASQWYCQEENTKNNKVCSVNVNTHSEDNQRERLVLFLPRRHEERDLSDSLIHMMHIL